MKTHDNTTSTIASQTIATAAAVRDNHSISVLTERELEHVAAAGAKKGIMPGNLGNMTK